MKALTLALLIPAGLCMACSNETDSSAMATPGEDTAVTNAAPAPDASAPAVSSVAGVDASAPGAAPVEIRTAAQASLIPAPGSSVMGDLSLASEGLAVLIRGEITGLAPGEEHGFHIHEGGECTPPDFATAGEHFNPTRDPHGGPKSSSRHLGDIPNIEADKSGRATVDASVKGVTLVDKDGGPNQILGKTLVIHAMPDDYKTQPSGGSGDRIACGVIR